MEYYHLKRGGVGLRNIPRSLADLLQSVPRAGRDSQKAESRLYPSPSLDPRENDLRQDWKTVVEPDLQQHFQEERNVVESDLRNMKEGETTCSLEIPLRHIDSWLNVLNQARLSLAAEFDFTDRELSAPGPIKIRNDREMALLQINFFAAIQHLLIEELEG